MPAVKRSIKAASAGIAVTLALTVTGCGGADSGDTSSGSNGGGKTLRVASIGDARPYTYTKNGKFTGFDVELFRAVAKEMDRKVKFSGQDFSGLLAAVKNGQYDVGAASIAITKERKKTVQFTNPYFVGYIAVLTKQGTGVKSKETLEGKKLGLVQGTIQDNYAKKDLPKTDITRFPDNNSALQSLLKGSIDAHFLDYPVAQDYEKKYNQKHLKIVAKVPTSDQPAAFAVAKSNNKLKKQINTALKKVIHNGTWVHIYKKFFPHQPVPKQFKPTKQQGT